MEQQLVVFELGREYFGVSIAAVESIIKMQAVTVVPHAPAFFEGVTNLRGSVLPVIDLRKRFDLAPAKTPTHNRIVVVAIDGVKVGMVVDGVSEVLRISDEAVEPTPPLVAGIDSALMTGIAKHAGRLVLLIDLSKILSLKDKSDLQSRAPVN